MVSALRHFFRGLRRRPGFAAAVIGVLGVGIAAGTVVFAVVDALVLDPYPFPDADRLLVVGSAFPSLELPLGFFERLSGPELVDVAERSRLLDHPLPFDLDNVRIHGPDYPLRLFTGFFWADPFPTLGVEPHLGRGFTAAAALAAAALLASTLPARRAGRLDPATSLREP